MYLINEDNDIIILFQLLDERLDTLFKLTTIFRTGHDAGHIKTHNPLVEKDRRCMALHNELGKSFYNGTFSYSRFTYQYWIIFLATA